VHYIARVGLDYVKAKVVADAANRQALYERLLYSLEGLSDPWAERIAGKAGNEYTPLTVE
jgi:nitrite reductase (NADH) large subunit